MNNDDLQIAMEVSSEIDKIKGFGKSLIRGISNYKNGKETRKKMKESYKSKKTKESDNDSIPFSSEAVKDILKILQRHMTNAINDKSFWNDFRENHDDEFTEFSRKNNPFKLWISINEPGQLYVETVKKELINQDYNIDDMADYIGTFADNELMELSKKYPEIKYIDYDDNYGTIMFHN